MEEQNRTGHLKIEFHQKVHLGRIGVVLADTTTGETGGLSAALHKQYSSMINKDIFSLAQELFYSDSKAH